MEAFKTSEFFISFTHQGVFLDKNVMDRSSLIHGDAVELGLSCRGKLASKCYGIVKSKDEWNAALEKVAYGPFWYSSNRMEEFLAKEECVILSYVEWNSLTLGLEKKDVVLMKPGLTIRKLPNVKPAEEIRLKVIEAKTPVEELDFEEYPVVVLEKQDVVILGHTKETRHRPINMRKVGLLSLPNLGHKRREALSKNGISTILELISFPTDKLDRIKGISKTLMNRWIVATSKVLEPSAFRLLAQVFLTRPRGAHVFVTKQTRVDVATPFYTQFFVRGHPLVESKVLGSLEEMLGIHFDVSMPRENVVKLERKDRSQEIRVVGPWIMELTGFESLEEVEDVLENLNVCISSAFDLWEDEDVFALVEPQRAIIEADQILNGLVAKLSLSYSSAKDLIHYVIRGEKIVIDTNILIDGRLSSLMVRAAQGTVKGEYLFGRPEIIVPNIVTFELKSMTDRYRKKETEARLGDIELLRLKALHDAGYLTLKHVGETPLFPPVTQYEKGLWKFIASLRDEFILRVVSENPESVLLTTDGRLARSAYIKGNEVVLMKRLVEEVKEEFQDMLEEYGTLSNRDRERLLKDISDYLLVPKETVLRAVNLIVAKSGKLKE